MNGLQERIGLWAYIHYQDMHRLSKHRLLGPKIERLWCGALELLMPRCWHKDCKERGELCVLRGYSDSEDVSFYWYCGEHLQQHGFCFNCGEFWGGTESFDFGSGYCPNCASKFEEEEREEEWEYQV